MMLGLMVMIMVVAFTIAIVGPLKDQIADFRNDRQCDNASANLTTNDKITCTLVDLYLPYFIAVLLIGSSGWLFYKVVAK